MSDDDALHRIARRNRGEPVEIPPGPDPLSPRTRKALDHLVEVLKNIKDAADQREKNR